MKNRQCIHCNKQIPLGSSFIFIRNRFDKKFYLCSECVDMVKQDILKLENTPFLRLIGREMLNKLNLVLEVLC